jgi:biopolymer transport protein ExbD
MRYRRRRHETDTELNITAFLNLMVVLIPFLLLNAVFAQVSVLNLNLPQESQGEAQQDQDEDKQKLILEILIYDDRYEIVDRNSGPLNVIENKEDGSYDREALNEYLQEVKEEFPDTERVTILSQDDTPYKHLIRTMDTARFYSEMINGQRIKQDLFPTIAIGKAPPDQTDNEKQQEAGGAS